VSTKSEAAASAIQALPSVTLVGVTLFGLTISEVAAVVGIAFIGLQAAHLVWRWWREATGRSVPR
jgi:ABC-type Fe3+-siderophore transport system permease subunit